MSNIITVSFANCGRVKYTDPLYQYDYGQILRITDLDLPLSFQAHFCNDGDTQTTTSIGLNNEVAIPDAYLQTGKGVICYIYLHTGNDDGETEYKIIFPVNPRQAITNQEPTPAQQSEIDQYIIALNTGVTSASESAEDSEAWAVGERNGEPVGSGDETYHNNAKYYAEQSGDIYDSIPSEVQRVLQEALDSGEFDGRGIESVTLNPDYTLTLYFTDGTSWTSTSIRGAQGEQGVQGETGNGIQSTELNADYTLTLNYTNGTSYTTPSIRGAQGANGTDGVGITSIYKTATQGNVDTYTILFTDGNTTDFEVTNGTIQSVNGKTGASITLTSEDINHGSEPIAEVLEKKAGALWDSASGSIVSIVPDKTIKNLEKVTCNIEPVQDLHGYDSPWPAGGGKNKFNGADVSTTHTSNWGVSWNEDSGTLTIQHKTSYTTGIPTCSLNLAVGTYVSSFVSRTKDASISLYVDGAYNKVLNNGTTFSVEAGKTYSVNFAADQGTDNVIVKFQIESGSTATTYSPYSNICPIEGWSECKVVRAGKNLLNPAERKTDATHIRFYYPDKTTLPSGTYTMSCEETVTGLYVEGVNGNISTKYNSNFMTFMLNEPTLVHFNFYKSGSINQNQNCQLEKGSSATSYSPYQGNSLTISLGQTVYGGVLDATEGVMRVERAMVDLGTLNWLYHSSGFFYNNYLPIKNATINAICSTYQRGNANGATRYFTVIGTILRIYDSTYSGNTTAFKTAMNGVQFCYELATTITISLTPQQIQALQGINNLWCDTGNISVDYAADLKTYIDNAIAQLA